jgi:GNAT superfamily N-acetyltransferase
MSEFTFRVGTLDDIPLICRHRQAMMRDMGYAGMEDAMTEMSGRFRPWVEERLGNGLYTAWFAETAAGGVAGGAALWIRDRHPGLLGLSNQHGYILNVYVEPEFRRKGLARRLMEIILERCKELGLDTVELHASDQGRPIYASMGFEPTNEMRLSI